LRDLTHPQAGKCVSHNRNMNSTESVAATRGASRLDEDDFAAATAAFLNKLSLDGTIKHLVVVSDPRTLGEMRKHFHRDLRGKIIGEFAKDFSRRPVEDIASLIADA
jgi:protein required for attachment to host cells